MKQLLILLFGLSILTFSCDDETTGTNDSATDSTTHNETQQRSSDSTTVVSSDTAREKMKLVLLTDGKKWVEAYHAMVAANKQVSLQEIPNMIWFSPSVLRGHIKNTNKVKFCLGVDPEVDPANPNKPKDIVVIIQTKIPKPSTSNGHDYEYYLMEKAKKKAEDNSFCPKPYPCAELIEDPQP